MITPSIAPIHQSWTLADSQKWVEAWGAYRDQTSEPQARLRIDECRNQLSNALAGHLAWLAHQEKLGLPEHAHNLNIRWLNAWTALIEAGQNNTLDSEEAGYAAQAAARIFSKIAFWNLSGCENNPDQLPVKHQNMIDQLTKGDFRYFDTEDLDECYYSGRRFQVVFTNWQPQLGHVNCQDIKNSFFEPLTQDSFPTITSGYLTINAPSGTLLISDWFRLEEFTSTTKSLDLHEDNINSTLGCMERSRKYAKQHIIHVFAGNSNPDVAQHQDGNLVIGQMLEEPRMEAQHSGRISTELWWVTALDKQTLIDIVAQQTTPEQALQLVDEYIQHNDVVSVQTEPGMKHVYFSLPGRTQDFQHDITDQTSESTGFSEVQLLIRSSPLTPQPKAPRF